MTCRQHAQRGFSLIEVLVAMTIMAVVTLLSWRALDMVERTNERLQGNTEHTLAMVRVLAQLETDIAQHASDDVLPSGWRWLTQASSSPALEITRSTANAWQIVRWRQDQHQLMRAVGTPGHTLPLAQPGQGDVVLHDIESFTLRGWVPARGWMSLPLPGGAPNLTGLEVTIRRQGQQGLETYRKVMLLQ